MLILCPADKTHGRAVATQYSVYHMTLFNNKNNLPYYAQLLYAIETVYRVKRNTGLFPHLKLFSTSC